MILFKSAIMGLVEGLTEFLPISSTGHLILTGDLIRFSEMGTEKLKAFEIIIQAGAILAVCWEYRRKLTGAFGRFAVDSNSRRFLLNLVIAFLPAAFLGLLFHKTIEAVLFKPVPVALAFIIGGLVIFWAERKQASGTQGARVQSVDEIMPFDAIKIGLVQTFALIPGTSRSGASIIGGMWLGLSRKAATEFSFFLAIPTLFAATFYSAYKERHAFVMADVPIFAVGLVVSFVSALFCVRWLLRYVSSHDFRGFAWYRIVFGLIVLATAYSGLVNWTQ